jgi:hypothetical protein
MVKAGKNGLQSLELLFRTNEAEHNKTTKKNIFSDRVE